MFGIDKAQLRPQFQFWSLHVAGTATPSFLVALIRFNSPGAIAGMLAGIATFICGYSLLCSTFRYQQLDRATLLGRSVKIGAKIRLWLSLGTGPFLVIGGWMEQPFLMISPDFWAGWAAFIVVATLFGVIGISPAGGPTWETDQRFSTAYSITVVEGLIISFTLVGIVFFALLYLNSRANRAGGQMSR